jgi:hypothetical protein
VVGNKWVKSLLNKGMIGLGFVRVVTKQTNIFMNMKKDVAGKEI